MSIVCITAVKFSSASVLVCNNPLHKYSTTSSRLLKSPLVAPTVRGWARRARQGCTLKESSSSECMLLRDRSSGSLSSSLVKVVAASSPWFCIRSWRRARISLSCRASTAVRSCRPDRSATAGGRERKLGHLIAKLGLQLCRMTTVFGSCHVTKLWSFILKRNLNIVFPFHFNK